MSCPPAPLSTVEETHDEMKKKKKQQHIHTHNSVQLFIDDKMVNCYCMAICMYVVALVNRISFEEGEEMNKVIDAINQKSCPSLWQLRSL